MTERPPARPRVRTPRHVDTGDGWTLAMELLTATFFWGGVGWLLDGWLGTAPLLMALGFVLGNGLGIYLIWIRSQDRFEKEHAELLARRAAPLGDTRAGSAAPDGTGTPAGSAASDGGERASPEPPDTRGQRPRQRDDRG